MCKKVNLVKKNDCNYKKGLRSSYAYISGGIVRLTILRTILLACHFVHIQGSSHDVTRTRHRHDVNALPTAEYDLLKVS